MPIEINHKCHGTYFTDAQRCDSRRVESAAERIASVNILHLLKAVITFVLIVLRSVLHYLLCTCMPRSVITCMSKVLPRGLLRYIPYTCPQLW